LELGAIVHYNRIAEAADVLEEDPEIVIVATGGTPNTAVSVGAENVTSAWEILSKKVQSLDSVLLFDDHGHHQGLSTAEVMASASAMVELVSSEHEIGSELGPRNFAIHLRKLYRLKVRMTPNARLVAVRRSGNQFECVLRNEYDEHEDLRQVGQVVVEHGTLPVDDVYFAIKVNASNGGAVALSAPSTVTKPDGKYQLFRIGDAVAPRNIHAAVFDAMRTCQDL
jgi:hypothetical protein